MGKQKKVETESFQGFSDSELVIGLVGAVGTDLKSVISIMQDRLKLYSYQSEVIKISQDIITQLIALPTIESNEYERITSFINAGNDARKFANKNDNAANENTILAMGAISKISLNRKKSGKSEPITPRPRQVYIIDSLKRPEEVSRLREVYTDGFFLLGAFSDEERRLNYLVDEKQIPIEDAKKLMVRDAEEGLENGQLTRETFHLSDFFIYVDNDRDKLKNNIDRILEVLFGHPYTTPVFDEYAMFMAFSAALRSADLSRQVGAVITKDNEIISTGANECPKSGGGLYWPEKDPATFKVIDTPDGRDYKREFDSNKNEQEQLINNIIECIGKEIEGIDSEKLKAGISKSRITDITEYGRVVHAEMEAILACARNNISTRGATLYCTTFPCHNCAKHIIAAGITRVVYVEPYPKSKAPDFHTDSVTIGFATNDGKVNFEPFTGVGPRRFFDLFSNKLGSGYPMKRKQKNGRIVYWETKNAKLRTQLLPISYLDKELLTVAQFSSHLEKIQAQESQGG